MRRSRRPRASRWSRIRTRSRAAPSTTRSCRRSRGHSSRSGYAAVRFNFRGVGHSGGAFDDGIGETDDALTVLAWARETFGTELPVVLAGFSFGTFVQTRVAQRVAPQRMVLVGPAVRRFAVDHVPEDTIVIHGEEDDVVPLADVLAWARPQGLPVIVFPGCGHFFHGRLPQLARVITGMWKVA